MFYCICYMFNIFFYSIYYKLYIIKNVSYTVYCIISIYIININIYIYILSYIYTIFDIVCMLFFVYVYIVYYI